MHNNEIWLTFNAAAVGLGVGGFMFSPGYRKSAFSYFITGLNLAFVIRYFLQ